MLSLSSTVILSIEKRHMDGRFRGTELLPHHVLNGASVELRFLSYWIRAQQLFNSPNTQQQLSQSLPLSSQIQALLA